MTCLTMFLCHNCTENTQRFHEQIHTLEKITDGRGMDPDGNIKAVCFFNDLVLVDLVLQVGKYGLNEKRQTS
jgi:hypothetical protein